MHRVFDTMEGLTDTRFCFSTGTLIITPNWRGNPQYLYVKVAELTRVKITPSASPLISYNPDTGASPEWIITSENMYLAGIEKTQPAYLYLRLLADGTTGILALSPVLRDDWLTKDGNFLYLHIGNLSAVSSGARTLTLINGTLGSDEASENPDLAAYARKDRDDDIHSLWTFHSSVEHRRGIVSEDYERTGNYNNINGRGFAVIIDLNGKGIIEADSLLIRDTATMHKVVVAKKTIIPDESDESDDETTENGEFTVEGDATVQEQFTAEKNATVQQNLNVGGNANVANKTTTKELQVAGDPNMQHEDIAHASSRMRTVVFGNYLPGLIAGAAQGAVIEESGDARFKSVSISEFLEVPEMRFNRALVQLGIGLRSKGGGIIELVEPDTDAQGNVLASGWVRLKLEKGEYGAIAINDKCLGFWHNEVLDNQGQIDEQATIASNSTTDLDNHNGDYELAGFQSIYFRIDALDGDGTYAKHQFADETTVVGNTNSARFHYVLRGNGGTSGRTYNRHPHDGMHFGQIANHTNTSRQALTVTTPEYDLKLANLTDWNYVSQNIIQIEGKLDGFSMQSEYQGQIYTKHFSGDGSVLANTYIYGKLEQFERVGYRCYVEQSLGGSIYPNETEVETVSVFDGYGVDVTSQFTHISVTRDSGDAASDALWNAQHTNVGNPFNISFADLGIDGFNRTHTDFLVTATDETTGTQTPASLLNFSI